MKTTQLERGQSVDSPLEIGTSTVVPRVRLLHRTSWWATLWPTAIAYGLLIVCAGLSAYFLTSTP
jgi:hypothetical protein